MKHKHQYIFPELALALSIKRWKNFFPNEEWKWMVCQSLNKLVSKEKVRIHGFMITNKNVMLVLENTVDEKERILRDLNHSLRKEIERKWKNRLQLLKGREEQTTYFDAHSIYEDDIFDHRPIINQELIHLLIGYTIEKPYEDPMTNSLIKECKSNLFCSYNEWIHKAQSPVQLISMKHEIEE